MAFLETLSNAVMARSSRELVGAMFIATALALVLSTVYRLSKRKVADTSMLVVVLGLFANVAGMLIGAGYVQRQPPVFPTDTHRSSSNGFGKTGHPVANALRGSSGFGGFGWSTGFHVLFAADSNRDGRLTREEFTEFVEKADTERRGSVDAKAIDNLILSRRGPIMWGPPGNGGMSSKPDSTWGPGVADPRSRRRVGRRAAAGDASERASTPAGGPGSHASREGAGT